MRKLKVLFTDLTHVGMGVNADVFPLGVAMVAAYALQEMPNELDIEIHKFPEDLNESIRRQMPDILCMSHVMWSKRLTYSFAEHVKKAHPATITIFGGPDFPLPTEERKEFLLSRPMIDFYIKWDGEHSFVQLLKDLIHVNLDVRRYQERRIATSNVCYVVGDDYVEGVNHRIQDLMTVPSPYTMGLLDKFFQCTLMPIFETTRGCPYSCTFCNDGTALRNQVHAKSVEFIHDELNYIAASRPKSTRLCFADLNFGMYQHDLETAKIIRNIRRKYHWPDYMQGSMGKSQPKRLVEVARIINEGNLGILKLGSSLQSTDANVLKAIKRKNLTMDQLVDMRKDRTDRDRDHLQDYTELILPLPAQTKETHFQSLRDGIDRLEINNIDVHQLATLKGSHMATRSERDRYKLQVRHRVLVGCLGIYDIGGETRPIAETEEMVVSTSTLTFEDYLDCRVMTLLVKIYIDNDPFKEIFALIRYLNQSPFDVLRHLKDQHLENFNSLVELRKNFIHGTKVKLFDTLEQLEEITSKPENIEKFISGEYGQNELLTHRVLAFRDHYDDLSQALGDATLSRFEEQGVLTPTIRRYLHDALRFCGLRRFDLSSMDEQKEDSFAFDFIKAEKKGFRVNPRDVEREVRLKFYYGDDDVTILKKQMERWDLTTVHQLGKFMQKANFLRARRRVKELSGERVLMKLAGGG